MYVTWNFQSAIHLRTLGRQQ